MSIVKNIKNLFSARLALLCCLVGTAGLALAGTKVYIEDFSIKSGEELTIAVNLDTELDGLKSLEGVIVMPEGLEVLDQDPSADSYVWMTADGTRASGAVANYNPKNGKMKISGFGSTIYGGTGAVAYIKVKATDALADGSTIALSGFKAKDQDGGAVEVESANATVFTTTPVVSFSPATLSLLPGATGLVEVQLENSMEITAGQATIEVSEGLEFAGLTKSARVNGEIIPNLETMTIMGIGTVAAGSGTVLIVGVKAAEGFTGGTIKMKDMVLTTKSAKAFYPKDIVIEVTLNDGTIVVNGGAITIDETKGTPEAGIISDGQTATTLNYTRTLKGGNGFYTVCLPYTPPTGAKYYELTGAAEGTLTFTEVASPQAETPYLATAASDAAVGKAGEKDVAMKQVTDKSSAAGGYTLKGTLTGLTNAEAAAAGAYILQAGGEWKKVTSDTQQARQAYIPPFRAYIVGGSAARLGTVLGETTAIENLRTVDIDGTEHWYDLNGRSIAAPAQRGIYIVNGKKVIK